MIDFCIQCDDGTKMQYGVKDLTSSVKNLSVTVLAVKGWHCPVCGECYFEGSEGKRYSDAIESARLASKSSTEE